MELRERDWLTMGAIFISYRRDDAEGQAGRLFDALTEQFGGNAVFMDVAAIEPGRDFRRAIDDQVSSCGVMLAVIGRNWLTTRSESGSRRLDDPLDFVRLETASALKRDIPVVPVLVQGARMPRAEDLPEDLKALGFRNSVELTHARWDSDMQVLVKSLRPYVRMPQEPTGPHPHSAPSAPAPMRTVTTRMVLASLAAVLVVALSGYVWSQRSKEDAVAGPTAAASTQAVPAAPTSTQAVPAAPKSAPAVESAPKESVSSPTPAARAVPRGEEERLNTEKIEADAKAARAAQISSMMQELRDQGAALGPKRENAPPISMTFARNSRAGPSVPAGHPLIGEWYSSSGTGSKLRITGRSTFNYSTTGSSSPAETSGTADVQGEKLLLITSDAPTRTYTFRFECVGKSEHLTLREETTNVETAYYRDLASSGQRCN
jgi:hypothetical protein